MEESKELEWGETPFTHMTREELEVIACKLYLSLSKTNSALNQLQTYARPAVEQAKQTLKEAQGPWTNAYRSYFRYASDLLFSEEEPVAGWTNWRVCPLCGNMVKTAREYDPLGKICGDISPHARPDDPQCPGIMRELTWDDLKPKNETKENK